MQMVNNLKARVLTLTVILTALPGMAQINYNFNDGAVPVGTTASGTARVADDGTGANGVLHLTDDGVASANGMFLIPDPFPGMTAPRLSARWKSLIGGVDQAGEAQQLGSGGADGYSFSWGSDLAGSGVGEEGTGTGLIVAVDTFDNGSFEAPGIEIKWRGARVAFDPIDPSQTAAKGYLRKNQFVDAEVTVTPSGQATFTYDGKAVSANLTGWAGITGGNFLFGGRTGGAHDNHWIDDLTIVTFTPGPVVFLSEPPASQTVDEGTMVTLSATVDGTPPYTVQWFKNGEAIAGATSLSYTFRATRNENGAVFRVDVSNEFGTASSRDSLLNVNIDNTPPTIVSASAASKTQIGICFSEAMEPSGAGDPFNYMVNGGANIIVTATVRADGKGVALILDPATPLVGSFTVSAGGIADVNGNSIPPDASATGNVWMAEAADIGGPLPAGSHFSCRDGEVEVTAGGADVWGTSDQFTFVYEKRVNNFDVKVRVDNLPYVGNNWSKAGLNIRETLDAGSRMAWTYPTPLPPGANQLEYAIRPNPGASVVDVGQPRPAINAYPFWVRVKRIGSVFTGYYSRDGTTWVQNGAPQNQPQFSAELFVGMGMVSHIQGTANTGKFSNYGDTILCPSAIISITQDPVNTQVEENHSATLSAAATAQNAEGCDLFYQWQAETSPGSGTFTNIHLATGPTLVTAPLKLADSGTRFRLAASVSGKSAISAEATVTVVPDTTPPRPLLAAGSPSFMHISITFDELLDPLAAVDPFNYSISGGLAVGSIVLAPDGKTVTIATTPGQTPDTVYAVTIVGVTDLAGNAIGSAEVSFRSFVPGCGGMLFEAFNAGGGNAVSVLTSHPSFPNNPTERLVMTAFDTRTVYPNDSHEGYGGRIRGLFIPPTSGNWILYLRSDDASELHFNPNGSDPAGKTKISEELGCCRAFDAIPSAPMPLIAGQAYYIEALYKEGTGGDYCQVAARVQGGAETLVPIPGTYLGQAAPAGILGDVLITQQPADLTVEECRTATFTVAASFENSTFSFMPICYQWKLNGVDILGATGPSYTTPLLTTADSGGAYTVAVSIMGASKLSAAATLTVTEDTTPPTCVAANGTPNLSTIVVSFSERLDPASAADAFNYSVPGFAVGRASLDASGTKVFLTVDPALTPDTAYSVTAQGITDCSGNPQDTCTLSFRSWVFARGFATRELYFTGGGVLVSDLRASPKFPNAPDIVQPAASLDAPLDNLHTERTYDNYGTRVSGFLVPPTTGNYNFFIAADDGAEFWLSTDETPAHLTLLCSEPQWNSVKDWTSTAFRRLGGAAAPENRSTTLFPAGIPLEAGKFYFFEALVKEQTGGDHLGITWQRPGDGLPAHGSPSIPRAYLASLVDPATVVPDTTAPQMTAAKRGALSPTAVTVVFNEPVDPASAATAANYSINGVTVTAARLNRDGESVDLTTDSALDDCGNYTVTVNGVRDLSGNALAADSQASIFIGPLPVVYFVGDPSRTGIGGAAPTGGSHHVSDQAIRNRLLALGFEVDVRDDNGSTTAMADNRGLVVVSATVNSGDIAAKFRNVRIGVVSAENAIFDDMLWTLNADPLDRGASGGHMFANIVDSSHPLAAGLPAGSAQLIGTRTRNFVHGRPNANAAVIARSLDGNNRAVLFGYERGAVLINNIARATARRVGIFLDNDTCAELSQAGVGAGLRLFDASIKWAMTPAIVRQPQSQTVAECGTVTFCVAASSPSAPTYQWFLNGAAIAGANSARLTRNNVGPADEGSYTCEVGNASGGSMVSDAATLTVVNQAPGFTKGPDVAAPDDFGPVSLPNWPTGIQSCPGETLTFVVSNDNPGLFTVQPSLSADGTLTFTPARDINCAAASANVAVALMDDRGTANGGDDTSDTQTFVITINPINDPPAAFAAPVVVAEGGCADVTLMGSDPDPNCSLLSMIVVSPPARGTLSGVPPNLRYCVDPDYEPGNIPGSDGFDFKVSDGALDSPVFHVSITITPVNEPPTDCVAAVSPVECDLIFEHRANHFAISLNNRDACLVLSGHAADPESDPLTFTWLDNGEPVAAGAVITNCFPLGCHTITMVAADAGGASCSTNIDLCVITPAEACEQCIELVETTQVERRNKRPLIVTLKAAKAAFDRDGWGAGFNMLNAFKYKVEAQIARNNPAEAQMFIECADNIMAAVDCVLNQAPQSEEED